MVTRFAKLGTEQYFLWAHPALISTLTDLTLTIYDESETVVHTDTASAIAAPLGMYRSDEAWLPAALGSYKLQWQSTAGGIDDTEDLLVASSPIGNEEVLVPRHLEQWLTTSELYEVDVYYLDGEDGTVSLWGSSPYITTESSTFPGLFITDDSVIFEDKGYYVLHWRNIVTPGDRIPVTIYVGEERGIRAVRIYLLDTSTDPYTPLDNVTVLVSKADTAEPVDQKFTNAYGAVDFALTEGIEYVASIRKTGYTFDSNNLHLTPIDPATYGIPEQANRFTLYTGYFQPTFDAVEKLDLDDLSLMNVDILGMAGTPIQGYTILVANRNIPSTFTVGSRTWVVLGNPVQLMTDANGHAEMYLVRGAEVEVTLEGTPVRRIFTVPDQSSFNLIDIITTDEDPFTAVQPRVPSAIRRTP